MDSTTIDGTRTETNNQHVYRQRGSTKADQDPDLPPKEPTYRTQIPLYTTTSTTRALGYEEDNQEREPRRYINQDSTYEHSQPMEEGIYEQWVEPEMLKDWISDILAMECSEQGRVQELANTPRNTHEGTGDPNPVKFYFLSVIYTGAGCL